MNIKEEFHKQLGSILQKGLPQPTRIFISRNLLYDFIRNQKDPYDFTVIYPYQNAILGTEQRLFNLPFNTVIEPDVFLLV